MPYFKKSENFVSDVRNRDKFHGVGGELTVTEDNYKADLGTWHHQITHFTLNFFHQIAIIFI